jgi:hypothetical protein
MTEQYFRSISEKPSAWFGHGPFASQLVSLIRPELTVDLGVDYGYSTFSFAYPRIGKVVGIDSFEGDVHAGVRDTYDYVIGLKKKLDDLYGHHEVEIIKGYFEEVARDWNRPIDILHIDGLHTYQAVQQDFLTWSKFLNPGGVVLFHDTIIFKDDVGKFFDELVGHKYNFEHWYGLGVWTSSEETFDKIKPLLRQINEQR